MLLISPIGCAAPEAPVSRMASSLEAEGEGAIERRDYGAAIDLMMPKARAGEPEAQFSVGYILLLWLKDDEAKERPQHSVRDGLDWIYKAAKAGVPQAAGVLSNAYRFGDNTLPKNAELEVCWRDVEQGKQESDVCLLAENRLR